MESTSIAGRVRPLTAEATGVSTQAKHPVHLRDRTDRKGLVTCLLCLSRRALQANHLLEQQVTRIDVVVSIYPTS